MKKIVLVDGNNLIFRSYYATAYRGTLLRNSKGFPTNALYGFISMIEKIIKEENPEYMAVAFDIGKNFRKEKYSFYKEGRQKTPDELHVQEPIARELLNYLGIPYFELAPYEADDIIGTLAKKISNSNEYEGLIVSSDRDLLQLISKNVEMKLLKQKDFIRYNEQTFIDDYGIEPVKIIDLKALSGDSSDNIPGIKGIGEKTALTLLQTYKSLDGIYENIGDIKGKTKEKLEVGKNDAYMSYEIATIYKEVPLKINLEDLKIKDKDDNKLNSLYRELEFYSLINGEMKEEPKISLNTNYLEIEDIVEIKDDNIYSFYLMTDKENYHEANIVGMALSTDTNNYYIKSDLVKDTFELIKDKVLYTYDAKKAYVLLNKLGIDLNVNTDLEIIYGLTEITLKEDITTYMARDNITAFKDEDYYKNKKEALDSFKDDLVKKSNFIYQKREELILELKRDDMYDLFKNIEIPLAKVLAKMEINGMKVDKAILDKMKEEYKMRISNLQKEIILLAGVDFNISSPRQLGNVLFETLALPGGKKTGTGYKTDAKVLQKLSGLHPIIDKIIEYRNVTKLYSTYIEGLENYIMEDGLIHTIFKQNLARTGRLSSTEPNLQNIPVRDEEGKKIREAFLPQNDIFYSADYSQIELRLLAHISQSKELQNAFINNEDIHKKVASDIYGVNINDVTKTMRSTAKSVIFGIVYGISGFGLGENLSISPKEAKRFIDKYYELYPGVKNYMDKIVEEAHESGDVRTLFKRRRIIPELDNSNYMIRSMGERIALNTPIQGTCADIIKKAMVKIDEAFTENNIKSKMVLQIHDELLFDVVEEEKEKVHSIVTDIMENIYKISVPLKVSGDFGKNWYETK